jgi:SecD/SecF fusion protein
MATNKKILLLASFLFLASLGLTSCGFFRTTNILLKADVGNVPPAHVRDILKRTSDVLKDRLAGLVDGPQIIYDVASGTISITYKGPADIERVKSRILVAGDLRFYDAYTNADFIQFLKPANDSLGQQMLRAHPLPTQGAGADTGSIAHYTRNNGLLKINHGTLVCDPLFAVLAVNVRDSEIISGPVVGYAFPKDTAQLTKYLNEDVVKKIFPPDARLVYGFSYGVKPGDTAAARTSVIPIYAIRLPHSADEFDLGTHITHARADMEQNNPCVDMRMDTLGAEAWHRMTARNVGKYIAVVYDGKMYSCPRVDNPISSGNTQISSVGFTKEQAQDIAHIMVSGRLPVPLSVVGEEVK